MYIIIGMIVKLLLDLVCGESNEVVLDSLAILHVCEQPLLGRGCVGDGLLCGECLRCHDEKSRFGVELLKSLC